MKNKVLIFGGTFNPLSLAHGELIKKVAKSLKIDQIVLVPTSDRFLKSWKNFDNLSILPSSLRLEILDEFVKKYPNIEIDLTEFNDYTYKTYDTLIEIKKRYPNSELYFCVGSEKIVELDTWYKYKEILEICKIVVIRRNFDDIESIKNNSCLFKEHPNSFIFLEFEKEYENISSTKIRDLINQKNVEELKKYTYDFVINILKERKVI